ncbi:hypothetical protein CHS0354_014360 [Potamilus streckersoni]|uniref:Uncharacterized protein n=1 Tax=Potamilus streckersoni TaxID=2493646 RepID=A0AAE0SLM4_9BIVA|nr:hypothetical protein CHS0354_014360 [Potamilus streckersoni]
MTYNSSFVSSRIQWRPKQRFQAPEFIYQLIPPHPKGVEVEEDGDTDIAWLQTLGIHNIVMDPHTAKDFVKAVTYVAWESFSTRRPTTQEWKLGKNTLSKCYIEAFKQHLTITLIDAAEFLSLLHEFDVFSSPGYRENQTAEEICDH